MTENYAFGLTDPRALYTCSPCVEPRKWRIWIPPFVEGLIDCAMVLYDGFQVILDAYRQDPEDR